MKDHELSAREKIDQYFRQSLQMHETALENLQTWVFAVCRLSKISAEDLAKAINEFPEQHSFGMNLQARMREATEKYAAEEKAKLEEQKKSLENNNQ